MRPQVQASRSSVISSLNLVTVTLVILSTLSCVTGSDLIHSHRQYSSGLAKRLVGDARLHFDTEAAPVLHPALEERQLGGGDDNSSSSSSAEPKTSTRTSKTISTSPTVTSSSSGTPTSTNGSDDDGDDSNSSSSTASSTSTSAMPTYTSKSLPVPFDTSLGTNFTTTACPNFFQSFLANSTFRTCAPISLLLQNSLSFFQAVRSPPTLAKTLDASCAASLAVCSPLMASIASNLISDANCGDDFRRQNPIVTQAYAGLLAYEPLYKASCLKDSESDSYCFWDAFTNANNNTSAASDSYPYYMAIGIALPDTSTPTCTSCLKQTMEIFAGCARMKGQPLAGTYLGAAKHLNTGCGNNFADATVQVAAQSSVNAAPKLVSGFVTISAIVTLISGLFLI